MKTQKENLAKFYERRNTFLFIWDTDGQGQGRTVSIGVFRKDSLLPSSPLYCPFGIR